MGGIALLVEQVVERLQGIVDDEALVAEIDQQDGDAARPVGHREIVGFRARTRLFPFLRGCAPARGGEHPLRLGRPLPGMEESVAAEFDDVSVEVGGIVAEFVAVVPDEDGRPVRKDVRYGLTPGGDGGCAEAEPGGQYADEKIFRVHFQLLLDDETIAFSVAQPEAGAAFPEDGDSEALVEVLHLPDGPQGLDGEGGTLADVDGDAADFQDRLVRGKDGKGLGVRPVGTADLVPGRIEDIIGSVEISAVFLLVEERVLDDRRTGLFHVGGIPEDPDIAGLCGQSPVAGEDRGAVVGIEQQLVPGTAPGYDACDAAADADGPAGVVVHGGIGMEVVLVGKAG